MSRDLDLSKETDVCVGGQIPVGPGILTRYDKVVPTAAESFTQVMDNCWTLVDQPIQSGEERGRRIEIRAKEVNDSLIILVTANTLIQSAAEGGAIAALGKSSSTDTDGKEVGGLNMIHEGLKVVAGTLGSGIDEPATITLIGMRHIDEPNQFGGNKKFVVIKQGGGLIEEMERGSHQALTYALYEGLVDNNDEPQMPRARGGKQVKSLVTDVNQELDKIVFGNPGQLQSTELNVKNFISLTDLKPMVDTCNQWKEEGTRGCATTTMIHNIGKDPVTGHAKMWLSEDKKDLLYFNGADKEPGSMKALIKDKYMVKEQDDVLFLNQDIGELQKQSIPHSIEIVDIMNQSIAIRPGEFGKYKYCDSDGVELLDVRIGVTDPAFGGDSQTNINKLGILATEGSGARMSDPTKRRAFEEKFKIATVWMIENRIISGGPLSFYHPGDFFPASSSSTSALEFMGKAKEEGDYRQNRSFFKFLPRYCFGMRMSQDEARDAFDEFMQQDNDPKKPGLGGMLGVAIEDLEDAMFPIGPSAIKCHTLGCVSCVEKSGCAERPFCKPCLDSMPADKLAALPPKPNEREGLVPVRWSKGPDLGFLGVHQSKVVQDLNGRGFVYSTNKERLEAHGELTEDVQLFLNRCSIATFVANVKPGDAFDQFLHSVRSAKEAVADLNKKKDEMEKKDREAKRISAEQAAFNSGVAHTEKRKDEEVAAVQKEKDKLQKANEVRQAKNQRQVQTRKERKRAAAEEEKKACMRSVSRKVARVEAARRAEEDDDLEEGEVDEEVVALERDVALKTGWYVPQSEWDGNSRFSTLVLKFNQMCDQLPFEDTLVGHHGPSTNLAGCRKFERAMKMEPLEGKSHAELMQVALDARVMMEKMQHMVAENLGLRLTSQWEAMSREAYDAGPSSSSALRSQAPARRTREELAAAAALAQARPVGTSRHTTDQVQQAFELSE
tara:strand:+ start:4843 stop:7695 length:2853 start_codon:yes stop_codon:yes gene_type:complete